MRNMICNKSIMNMNKEWKMGNTIAISMSWNILMHMMCEIMSADTDGEYYKYRTKS